MIPFLLNVPELTSLSLPQRRLIYPLAYAMLVAERPRARWRQHLWVILGVWLGAAGGLAATHLIAAGWSPALYPLGLVGGAAAGVFQGTYHLRKGLRPRYGRFLAATGPRLSFPLEVRVQMERSGNHWLLLRQESPDCRCLVQVVQG